MSTQFRRLHQRAIPTTVLQNIMYANSLYSFEINIIEDNISKKEFSQLSKEFSRVMWRELMKLFLAFRKIDMFFVNCCQFIYLVISFLVLKAEFGI